METNEATKATEANERSGPSEAITPLENPPENPPEISMVDCVRVCQLQRLELIHGMLRSMPLPAGGGDPEIIERESAVIGAQLAFTELQIDMIHISQGPAKDPLNTSEDVSRALLEGIRDLQVWFEKVLGIPPAQTATADELAA